MRGHGRSDLDPEDRPISDAETEPRPSASTPGVRHFGYAASALHMTVEREWCEARRLSIRRLDRKWCRLSASGGQHPTQDGGGLLVGHRERMGVAVEGHTRLCVTHPAAH